MEKVGVTPFNNAIDTLKRLKIAAKHMETKWKIYESNGYLPHTEVFDKILRTFLFELENRESKGVEEQLRASEIESNKTIKKSIESIFGEPLIPLLKDTMTMEEGKRYDFLEFFDEDNRYVEYFQMLVKDYEDISEEAVQYFQQISKEEDDANYIGGLTSIHAHIYTGVKICYDMINATEHIFRNRLVGVFSSDVIYGRENSVRKFGGLQLMYNASESLLKDYTKSINWQKTKVKSTDFEEILGNDYTGLVGFGFRNRALTYSIPQLIILPHYALRKVNYFPILAHEAFHILDAFNFKRLTKRKEERNIVIKGEIQNLLENSILVKVYGSEENPDRNTPKNVRAHELAKEIMADIFAVCVAGDAYAITMSKYYLPLLVDMECGDRLDKTYAEFRIGSLRLRIILSATEHIWGKVLSEPEKEAIKRIREDINRWENLSLNIPRLVFEEKKLKKYKLLKNNKKEKWDIQDKIEKLEKDIKNMTISIKKQERLQIYDYFFHRVINTPYLYISDGKILKEQKDSIKEAKDVLTSSPDPLEVSKLFDKNEYPYLMPRHIISLFVKDDKKINVNSVLMYLAHHKNILDRFENGK
ncbi:hypothetical protein BEH94_10360 [Candidatus Altiarchaeales archaeon WOR_SM1_SCG]|nr:hypothetical protein BEH94_10360 [Candidatus Altiarchaeales archaeon WOR_SM1_SCG]